MKTPKTRRANDAIAIVTYGDHEVITPENRLRGAVSTNTAGEPHDDPVARAEKALAELSCRIRQLDGFRVIRHQVIAE